MKKALMVSYSFAWLAGLAIDVSLSGAWIALAAGGSAMSIWFFSHCRGSV
jgi:hypothetical protein